MVVVGVVVLVGVDVLVGVVVVVVDVLVVVVVVVVVVVGGPGAGTRTFARKRLLIVSGGSTRSTSWIRFANTVMRQIVPASRVRLGVSVNADAGDELNENPSARPLGHANANERRVARTRSLKRTVSTPPAAIDTELTRGARSADADEGTRCVNHDVPPATETPKARPSGAASANATTFDQQNRKRPLPTDDAPV